MAPFPKVFPDFLSLGHWGQYIIYMIIGFGFGFALEMSGFGNSKKLAAQFYFKEMTVLKVMFTAIVVAMVLVFLASGLGWLDYNLVWVNPTYLWPGIVGGLIMGVGFIVGGFCPGTSLVAAATAKMDGIFFTLGGLFGMFLFGETVDLFDGFYNSAHKERFTLPGWLGVNTGIVVLGIVLMAIFVFFGAEQIERLVGKRDLNKEPKWRYGAAGTLALAAMGVAFIGQPTTQDRWKYVEDEKNKALTNREVQIHPAELLTLMYDDRKNLIMLDVRSESDYNQFHILDTEHVPTSELDNRIPDVRLEPANSVFVLISNDETAATEAWKTMIAESVPNVYILEGGINNWISTFGDEKFLSAHPVIEVKDDQLRYEFTTALGARYPAALPLLEEIEGMEYTPKVKLNVASGPGGGGCG
ncbi:MAG TPA: YeeE/YedE thiosulfate transporter family protein [Aggregatilineaceae bacterium]|nr:YeeE/YedE thiosulfate transporter family protein [Aggregatilineaceae bacterium]